MQMIEKTINFSIGLMLFLSPVAAWALTPIEIVELRAFDGRVGDRFGISVSLDDNTALVGADTADDKGMDSGSAYVFVRDNKGHWSQQDKLNVPDGSASDYDYFGYSVSVDGDTALVGAHGGGYHDGSAYVFVRDNSGKWNLQTQLTRPKQKSMPKRSSTDYFGFSVSINGDTALIGAFADSLPGTNSLSGSAYVFVRDNNGKWNKQATKLISSDSKRWDAFGWSVSVDGDTALIGATGDDDKGTSSGSAYIFERNSSGNWTEQAKLIASDGAAFSNFGTVLLNGKTALVGAHAADENDKFSGSAYVFERNTNGDWNEKAKLIASNGAANDHFGWSVSMDNHTALIGALYHDDKNVDSGSAYVFVRDSSGKWTEQAELTAFKNKAHDTFGWSVSVDGNTALVGAIGVKKDKGSAYVFSLAK